MSSGGEGVAYGGMPVPPARSSPAQADRTAERVRQTTREQVPALTKMKQQLNSQQVGFVQMTSDALHSGWNPEFDYKLACLADEVAELVRQEAMDEADAAAFQAGADHYSKMATSSPSALANSLASSPSRSSVVSETAYAPAPYQPYQTLHHEEACPTGGVEPEPMDTD